jgi:uncharacterized protein YyaL (SSP411 family)
MSDTGSRRNGNERILSLDTLDKSTLPPDGGPGFNRLVFSKSPYLLQHAENPVDWYPWCEEAFEKARREDKPIFLSIGYATCHWCHVMERESFEDADVAAVLNDKFVAVKVDREERPDIDDQYMTVAQMLTGGGGWPLTILMTADKQPFFAATYLPKTAKMGMPGIVEVLNKIDDFWRNNRPAVLENCTQVLNGLASAAIPSAGSLQDGSIADGVFRALKMSYDGIRGGFGEAPKFPFPLNISFLIRYWKRTGATVARDMAVNTLTKIRQGGIFDQIGFGLHRYSVDSNWLVPHFEKMLYDQAMMAHACLDAFQGTGDARNKVMAEEIFSFVLRDMAAPEGGFYSAWDADTNGSEGEFYTWTPEEIGSVLGEEAGAMVNRLFGVTQRGNFEGRTILNLESSLDGFASKEGISPDVFQVKLEAWRNSLLAVRKERPHPLRDEKILSGWNGLMISALAKGYAVTGDIRYREAADGALSFVRNNLKREDGRLLRGWYRGEATVPAFLEDYAFLIWGLIELYEATLEPAYLDEARGSSLEMIRLFSEREDYGLFDTASDADNILVRKKGWHDGVIPSGNAVAAMCLIRLGKIARDTRCLEEGKGILRAFMGSIARQPMAGLHFLAALDYLSGDETEITFSGHVDSTEATEMLRAVRRRYIPGLVLRLSRDENEGSKKEEGGKTIVHVCAGGACRLPVSGIRDLEALLDEVV